MKNKFALIILLAIFLLLRLPGLSLPYHQDEWKNVHAAELGGAATSGLYHPPLTQLLLKAGVAVFGADHLRLLPLFFSVIAAWLLFEVMRRRASDHAAWLAVFLYAISFYGVWSSLQIDTDGAILPVFFLLAVYLYDRQWWWLTGLALLAGLLVKLSFILVVGALLIDFLLTHRQALTKKRSFYIFSASITFFILFAAAVFIVQRIYPAFSIEGMIAHARSFAHLSGRNYIQVVAQAIKAIFYLSPLLLLPLLFISREIFKQTRIFFIYLALGFVFYFILFDFSAGALDKYLMFTIIPLAAISGAVISQIKWTKKTVILGVVSAIALFALNFLAPVVLPLYPKTDWFGRVLHGEWNFLNPFNGGSGPTGFYVSFLFIAAVFIFSTIVALAGSLKKDWRPITLAILVIIGLVYNGVMAEELMFGKINGSAPRALRAALDFIADNPNVKPVLTYNDIGAYELSKLGKYVGRFYAAPQFEAEHRQRFAAHTGDFLVVDMPHINQDSFYTEFFSKCDVIFETESNVIPTKIYSCSINKK
ncbi:MAG: glycosyltransferase family 39 protein [Candidatus Vogelbacteria bacterium]|nr:glycosyltransferase family 39 protein [Candidatus Vogelbacteria bacterium]